MPLTPDTLLRTEKKITNLRKRAAKAWAAVEDERANSDAHNFNVRLFEYHEEDLVRALRAVAYAEDDLEDQRTRLAVQEARRMEKEAQTFTCQICARRHLPAPEDQTILAHHGYKRPGGGWQTASCSGAKHEPFEVTNSLLLEIGRAHV